MAEKIDLEINKLFIGKAGGYEGKLFAISPQDASIFGKNFFPYDEEPFYIVEAEIDSRYKDLLDRLHPDESLGVGNTFAVDRDNLDDFNYYVIFKILNYVEYQETF